MAKPGSYAIGTWQQRCSEQLEQHPDCWRVPSGAGDEGDRRRTDRTLVALIREQCDPDVDPTLTRVGMSDS